MVRPLCLNFRLITAKFLVSENLGFLRYTRNFKGLDIAPVGLQTGLCLTSSQGHNFHKLLFSTFQKYYIRCDGEKIFVLW